MLLKTIPGRVSNGIPASGSLSQFRSCKRLSSVSRLNIKGTQNIETYISLCTLARRHPSRAPPALSSTMQRPTLTNVRVSSTRDALQIFYAVARNVLPMITRRLDAEERRAIAPGNVYIWEERCANAEVTGLGMERW